MKWFYGKLTIFLLSALLLSSCGIAYSRIGGAGAVTPESAAITAVIVQQGGNFTLDQNSIQVLQTQQLAENYALVQIAYQGFQQAQQVQCLSTHAALSSQGGWRITGGASGCVPAGQDSGSPLDVSQNSNSGGGASSDPGNTAVDGFVNDARIKTVSVTWQDGQVQQVSVVNGAYLAGRLGKQAAFQTIQGLDENGVVIYTFDQSPPAPGKTSP